MVWEGVDWIHLAQDRNEWRAVVYTVMNRRVSIKGREFLNQTNDYQLLKKDSYPWSQLVGWLVHEVAWGCRDSSVV
jgi:hypothetical protein